MNFCPGWVFDIAVAQTACEFLSAEITLNAVGAKYANGLSEKYAPVSKELMTGSAESFLTFLTEVDAGEQAVIFLNGFVYFKYNFETFNNSRKLNPLFGAADEPSKLMNFSGEEALKHFKAYVFGLRSNLAPVAPAGWKLAADENVLHISDISRREISILDGF